MLTIILLLREAYMMADKTKLRIFSVIIGVLAVLGLAGPYVFGSIFNLVVEFVPTWVKVVVTLVFLVANTLTMNLKGNKIWCWVCVILSVVMASFWMDSIILAGITAWKNCTIVRTVSIVMFAIAAIVNVIDFLVARKPAEGN